MSSSDRSFYDYFKENKRLLLPICIGAVLIVLIAILPFGKTGDGEESEEERLTETISNVSGVGRCEVMLSYADDGEVEGVIVLCEGADSVAVRQSLTDLLGSLYGIGRGRISILKIKE